MDRREFIRAGVVAAIGALVPVAFGGTEEPAVEGSTGAHGPTGNGGVSGAQGRDERLLLEAVDELWDKGGGKWLENGMFVAVDHLKGGQQPIYDSTLTGHVMMSRSRVRRNRSKSCGTMCVPLHRGDKAGTAEAVRRLLAVGGNNALVVPRRPEQGLVGYAMFLS